MIRNLKTLGLALAAIVALSAIVASAAQAEEGSFTYEAGTTELTATQDATGGNQAFSTTSGNVECNEVHGIVTEGQFSAHEATGEEIEYAYNGSNECPSVFGTKATIDMMGCHYTFKTGETTAEMTVDGTVTIEGCEEDPTTGFRGITVHGAGCSLYVPEQTLGPVTYTANTEAGDVTIEPEISGIEYTHEGFLCGTGTAQDGTYAGNLTVRGLDAYGIPSTIGVE